MQCRSHAAQLGRAYEQLKAAGIEVLVILGDSLEKAENYAATLHLPFPVLSDPERSIYHRYGLEKALIFMQRTASVVVDPSGMVRYLKRATNPMEWLSETEALLQWIKSNQLQINHRDTESTEKSKH